MKQGRALVLKRCALRRSVSKMVTARARKENLLAFLKISGKRGHVRSTENSPAHPFNFESHDKKQIQNQWTQEDCYSLASS